MSPTTAHGIERITQLVAPLIPNQPIEAQIEMFHALAELHPSPEARQQAESTCILLRRAEASQLRFTDAVLQNPQPPPLPE